MPQGFGQLLNLVFAAGPVGPIIDFDQTDQIRLQIAQKTRYAVEIAASGTHKITRFWPGRITNIVEDKSHGSVFENS